MKWVFDEVFVPFCWKGIKHVISRSNSAQVVILLSFNRLLVSCLNLCETHLKVIAWPCEIVSSFSLWRALQVT